MCIRVCFLEDSDSWSTEIRNSHPSGVISCFEIPSAAFRTFRPRNSRQLPTSTSPHPFEPNRSPFLKVITIEVLEMSSLGNRILRNPSSLRGSTPLHDLKDNCSSISRSHATQQIVPDGHKGREDLVFTARHEGNRSSRAESRKPALGHLPHRSRVCACRSQPASNRSRSVHENRR